MDNRKMKRGMMLLVVFLFGIASLALAAVPGKISYQGKLTDDIGTALDGTYNMRFDFYDALAGGPHCGPNSRASR